MQPGVVVLDADRAAEGERPNTARHATIALRACGAAAIGQARSVHSARHLASPSDDVAAALRRRGREVWPLRRRGAVLGHAVTVHRTMPTPNEQQRRWRDGEPVFLPGVLGDAPRRFAMRIDATLRMFDRLREHGGGDPTGEVFLDELSARLADDPDLVYAGSTVDRDDPREVERVFVNAEPNGELVAEDIWAKLAWIAHDERESSLRIRFSNGLDQLEQWMTTGDLVASWVDQFAQRAFPECDAVLRCAALRERLDALLDRPHRLSERIVYNNAPDGGAAFHHDAEPGQLGVVFSQLEGHTAWFSLSKRRLAALLERHGYGRRSDAMRALDDNCDARLLDVCNRDEAFARLLAAHGALFVLRAGDSILLPSHGIDDVAWHSVLALGDRPSLAHSYGLFPRGEQYDPAGDPWLGAAAGGNVRA